MSRIFWDTNLFVYLMEDYRELSERVITLRKRMLRRGDQLYTSTLTLGEVLVKPVEAGNRPLREKYEEALRMGTVLIPFNEEAARIYAEIRQDRTIRPPDAIQLACAAQARVDLFITNDERLSEKAIPGIQFLSSLQKAFL
ncbi:PIN domain-containing protein [Acidobacteria bacterium AH-259-O06]|nr:PIN domain-containing protein [Acidobacteria bacterium AH-259-L09]MDA2927431.1 PIN domain-containing protein [Acidobacteria bacterium AH-259-G07]MDA2928668.1 PIN domain-containing protein [Acidobacteria bacterium AH-259-O06]